MREITALASAIDVCKLSCNRTMGSTGTSGFLPRVAGAVGFWCDTAAGFTSNHLSGGIGGPVSIVVSLAVNSQFGCQFWLSILDSGCTFWCSFLLCHTDGMVRSKAWECRLYLGRPAGVVCFAAGDSTSCFVEAWSVREAANSTQ